MTATYPSFAVAPRVDIKGMMRLFVVLVITTTGCIFGPKFSPGEDGRQWLPPTSVPGLMGRHDREKNNFELTPAFYADRLWVSSTSGVLEIKDGKLTGLHRWSGRYPGVAFAFRGPDGLWVHPLDPFSLVRFDGKRWQTIPMPPMPGDVTFRDIQEDFRISADNTRLWLNGVHHVWEWNGGAAKWDQIMADGGWGYHVFAAPIDAEGVFIIPRQDPTDHPIIHSDILVDREGTKRPIRAAPFLTEEVVTASGVAWIRTNEGHVLRATSAGVDETFLPGFAVAIGGGSHGPLLALVRDQGVYAFDSSWQRRIPWPADLKVDSLSFPAMTEDRGTVAIAANGRLWMSRAGGSLLPIALAP